jgi:hypothetical protein
MTLTGILEALSTIIKDATKIPVKVGWISPNDTIPLITIMHMGGGAEIMALTEKTLRTYEFQIDIWHKSAKSRDQAYEQILDALLKNWKNHYQSYGWWSVNIYRTIDIEEEGVFRKTMLLVLKEVVG